MNPSDIEALLRHIDSALTFALQIQRFHPELSIKEIGNIDEVITNLSAAQDVAEHVEGNLKAQQP